jgi:hypothetical protein
MISLWDTLSNKKIGTFVSKVVAVVLENVIGCSCKSRADLLEKFHKELFW